MQKQIRETVVFIDKVPCKLRYNNILEGSVHLYYQYKCEPIYFDERTDFTVNCIDGYIYCISDKITNYNKSIFYNVKNVDHTKFETFGNYDFTYFVEYTFNEELQETNLQKAIEFSKDSIKLSHFNEKIRYVVFGDSISTGAEASCEQTTYFGIFANEISKNLGIEVELINGSIGGDTSSDAMKRFEKDALSNHPDVCTIAFGMNDQNKSGENGCHFVEPNEYEANIRHMIIELQKIEALVILVAPCIPNLRWNWASGDTALYSNVLNKLSKEYNIPFADVTSLWKFNLDIGKTPESLLLNDINHPNDYGHSIYADALIALI
jgi:acyl-CoA thioesterase-1